MSIEKASEEDFPELYEGTFVCQCCGNRFDIDCEVTPDLCGYCEENN